RKIVLKWTFLIGTLLFPILGLGFAVVPAIIFSLKGEPTRIVVVDNSRKILPRLKENLSAERIAQKAESALKEKFDEPSAAQKSQMKQGAAMLASGFAFVDYDAAGKTPEAVRSELNGMATRGEIDAYLLIPPDIDARDAQF